MNSRTINRRLWALAFLFPVLLMGAGEIRAQIVVANPLEWAVLVEGNELIDGQNKSVDGYASSLKAATHLYNDGVRLFINLCDIRKAIANNPQGVAATFSMNNLYAETATELIAVYTTLKDAVATGGEGNMLTGAERSKTLWLIEDRLKAFNHKLSCLSLSLRYYTLSDVWYNATEGIIDRDYGDIARAAQSRWKRASRTY